MNHLDPIDLHQPGFGEFYDELPLWSAPFGLMLLERVPMRPGLTILDVGAGTGFLTLEMAQRCGPGSRVIAVDPWKSAMARLERKRERLGLDHVRLIEGDAATLDLPDASVDVIVSNLGINNFENAAAVLNTCFRVARPGAALLLTTNLKGHMAEFYEAYRETLLALGRADRIAALDAHVGHRATVESVSRQLGAAGFEVTNVVTDSFHMRFANGSALLRHHFIRLGFVPAWRAIAEGEGLGACFDALERHLDRLATQRGDLALTIPMALIEARKP